MWSDSPRRAECGQAMDDTPVLLPLPTQWKIEISHNAVESRGKSKISHRLPQSARLRIDYCYLFSFARKAPQAKSASFFCLAPLKFCENGNRKGFIMNWRKTKFSNLNTLSGLYKLSSACEFNKISQILFDLTKRSLFRLTKEGSLPQAISKWLLRRRNRYTSD